MYTKNEYKSEIADAMNKCDNDKDFSLIEKEIMNKVLKEKPNKRSSLNSIIKNKEYDKGKAKYYIYCLFSKDLYKYFKKVVIKFRYVICKGTYRNSLLGLMKQVYGCKDHKTTEELAIKFLGWVNNKCQELMDQNEMVIIDSHEFSKFAKQYIGVFIDGERYRTHSFLEPSNKDITEEIFDNPKYIKQLDLINIGTNGKNMAAYVYLKLLLERKNWIESGFLSCIEDFKYVNYQKSVKRNWSEKEEFLYESDDVKKGQTLYQSINQNLDFGYFDGVDLDPNLKKGFIQELANLPVSNPLSIGWHPNYIDLLQDDEENEK